ncbi:MAG: alginate export family protein, partial [Parvibaculum sp.]
GRYDDGVSKRTGYPTIGDPEDTELNRAQISYESDVVDVTVGRQRIQLGNMRFVGNEDWRQNEQTFDAARVDLNLVEDLTLTYVYLEQVNRTFGDNAANGRYQSDSHLGEVTYAFTPNFSAKAYSYLISLDEAPTVSTANYGLRLMADFPLGDAVTLSTAAEYAHQTDYDNNTTDQSLDYYRAEANLAVDSWTLMLGAEVLGSDGQRGFSFPIASNHGHNGWADVFASKTPAEGLVDLWVGATVDFGKVGPFKSIAATAIYHDFSSDRGSIDFGQEVDLGLKAKLPGGFGVGLVGETYGGADTLTDTNKVSLYLTYAL